MIGIYKITSPSGKVYKGTRKNKTSFRYYNKYLEECNKIINTLK